MSDTTKDLAMLQALELSFKHRIIMSVYEWCNEHYLDANLLVTIDQYCQVPRHLVDSDGDIAFSLHPESCINLEIGREFILFDASFDEVIEKIIIPIERVKGMYDAEHQKGLFFSVTPSLKPYVTQKPVLHISTSEAHNNSETQHNNHIKNKSIFKIIK